MIGNASALSYAIDSRRTAYYRVIQVDVSGQAHYSNLVYAESALAEAERIRLYPTVVSESIYIQIQSPQTQSAEVSVFDLNGRLVFESSIKVNQAELIDLSSLKTGMYLVELKTAVQRQLHRIVKQ
jgi:hypothetical protein